MAQGDVHPDDLMTRPWSRTRAWLATAPQAVCWISYAVAPAQTFALPMLAIPAAAILGFRYGTLVQWPLAILLAPMLISYGIGPAALTGSVGLYFSALLFARVAGDAQMRGIILSTTQSPSPRSLGVLLFIMPWFVATPAIYGVQLSIDLWFLVMTSLLMIGAGQAPLGPVIRWVIGAWLFGFAMRLVGFPLAGPFGSIGFGLGSPADLLTAMVAVCGPRALRPSEGTARPNRLAALLLAGVFLGALLTRVRLILDLPSLLGPAAQFGITTEVMVALLAAASAFVLPKHWWWAPFSFALARMPMSLLLPNGFLAPPVRVGGGGILVALCQTAVIVGFAWMGARAALSPRPLPSDAGDEGFVELRRCLKPEIRRGVRVLLVVLLLATAWLVTLMSLD